MATIQVPVAKCKGQFVEIDTDKIDADVWSYLCMLGAKSLVNRGTSGPAKKGLSADEYMAIAKKQVEDMYAGKTRIIGAKKTAAKQGKEMTEAIRIAKDTVKSMIKSAGEKISHYSQKDLTDAAKIIVENDPDTYLAAARENLARAAGAVTKGSKVDLMSMIQKSEKKVAAAEAKAAEKKTETSAAKAGKVVPKAKPVVRPHA